MASLINWAKKAANTVYHGVNPLDHGQGWTNQAPTRYAPVQQQAPPQQQRPQFQGQAPIQMGQPNIQRLAAAPVQRPQIVPLAVTHAAPVNLNVGNRVIHPNQQAQTGVTQPVLKGSMGDRIGAFGYGTLSSAEKAAAATVRGAVDGRFLTPNFIPGVSSHVDPFINKTANIVSKPFSTGAKNIDLIARSNGLYDTKAGQQGKAIGNITGASAIYAPQIPGAVKGGIEAGKLVVKGAKQIPKAVNAVKRLEIPKLTPLNEVGSIARDLNGKKFVNVDKAQHLFDNVHPRDHPKVARDYLNNNFKGKSVQVDGVGNVSIGRKAVGKYTNVKNPLPPDVLSAKMRLAPEIDNALKISQHDSTAVAKSNKHQNFAKDGFSYRTFEFEVGGKRFSGTANIAKNGELKNFYDVNPIKKHPLSGISAEANNRRITDVSTPILPDESGFVKLPWAKGDASSLPNVPLGKGKLPQVPLKQPHSSPQRLSPPTERSQLGSQVPLDRGYASPNSTPAGLNTQDYIRLQTELQDAARKGDGGGRLANIRDDFKKTVVDSFAPIEDTLNKAMKQGAKIAPENNIKYQIDRALRAETIGGQYIKDQGLAHIIQSAPDTKALDQYLIAKHAADLEANGVKTGRNLGADRQLVQDLAPQYEAHAQAINKYNHQLLDKATEYGLVSPETATMLKQKYPNYVPANRIFGEGEVKVPKGIGGGKASLSNQSVVQRIKGSERNIESPLASIVKKTQDVIDQGERNKTAGILASYKELPGNPFNLRELKKNETIGVKPVISYIDNGVTRRFETTQEIAAAAKSLDKQQLGIIGQVAAIPTRVLRLGATGVNVGFTMANVTKDVASAFINSEHPLAAASPTAIRDAFAVAFNHGSKQYAELLREGAGGTSFDIARNAPVQNVQHIRAQKNITTKTLYTVTHPAQLLRAVENTIGRSEEFGRAAQYYSNKRAFAAKGATEAQSRILGANAARNNTVNFARAGTYGRVANSVLPYLNAGIQGSRTLMRNIKDRPVQTFTKIAIVGFLPTATTTAWNLGSADRKAAYDDISEYEKQGNIIIVPPHPHKDPKTGRWNVIKIPVSQEIANMNNIVRNGVEATHKDAPLAFGKIAGDLLGTATSLNAQSGRQVVGQVTPQAIKPVLEGVVNQNLFTGNKIIPDTQKNLEPKDQYGDYTSGTAKMLGRVTGASPRIIDNFIKTAGGGVGQNLTHISDQALAKAGVIKPNEVQGKGFGESISNRFVGASGSTAYSKADQKQAALNKQLQQLPGYKSMTPQDKAKALNRLQGDVSKVYIPAKDPKTQTPLSPRQQHLMEGKPDLTSYLTKQKSGGSHIPVATSIDSHSKKVLSEFNTLDSKTKAAKVAKEYDYEYKVAKAKYLNDKAQGKISPIKDLSRVDDLAKLKASSGVSKDTRTLYGLSADKRAKYLASVPDATGTLNQLRTLDQSLVSAGVRKNPAYGPTTNGIVENKRARTPNTRSGQWVSHIQGEAAARGLDPHAVLAVAAVEGLGGGVGDGGTSFGPFQMHVGGALPPGKDRAWAESPEGINYALDRIAEVAKGRKGQDAIDAIVRNFERPLDPNGEVARAGSLYGKVDPYSKFSTTSAGGAGYASSGTKGSTSSGTRSGGSRTARSRSTSTRVAKAPSGKLSVTKIPKLHSIKTPHLKAHSVKYAKGKTAKYKTPKLAKYA